jgi:hypothetical protein
MAIDRVSAGLQAPLITQRFEVSVATPLASGSVLPLVPIGPFMTAAPDPGAGQPLALLASQSGTASAEAAPRESTAMQANQLFFSRQLVWHAQTTAALAASWRVMVRTYGEQRAAVQEQARGQHMPGTLFMAEQNQAALREGARPPMTMDAEAWRFAVYGWGGQRLTLRVLASDPEQAKPRKRRRGGKVALRLELRLPDGGAVVVQMEPAGDGVLLVLAADESDTRRRLRERLPELAAVVERCGLRIVHCRLTPTLHPVQIHNNYSMQAAAAELSPPLFRAMAEAAVLLSRPPARSALQPEAIESSQLA